MKTKLNEMLTAKLNQRKNVFESLVNCNEQEQRSALNETLTAIDEEIENIRSMIAELPAETSAPAQVSERGMAVIGAMTYQMPAAAQRDADFFDSEEYRTAFMNYACRNVPLPADIQRRADEIAKTADASAVIPTTTANEIIKTLESYGELYARVRKMNVQGGVKIPILSLKPTATWITADTGTSESEKQKLTANTYVVFNYYGLECKVAQTLLVNVTTLQMFQQLFATLAAEAIAKAIDIAIIKGSGSGELLGITVDERVPAKNKITLSAEEVLEWSAWKKKVFGKMAKSYRNGAFIMAQGTFDGYIDGMVDTAGQPIGRVNYNVVANGTEAYRFGGKEVITVENDVIADYDSAASGDVIAVFVNLSDYAINSNMQLTSVRWVDHDTNEIKNKVMLICDGKLVDANGVLVIKKA